jgi:hypothetical protein
MAMTKTKTKTSKPAAAKTTRAASVTSGPDVTDDTLDRSVARAVKFLLGVGTIADVRQALDARGYDDAEHARAWTLVDRVSGRTSLVPPAVKPAASRSVDARRALEAWIAQNLPIAAASLQFSFPAQHAFVFAGGLEAADGADGVVAAQQFLARVEALGGPKRGADRDGDQKALAQLERRGVGADARAELRTLVAAVQKGDATRTPAAPVTADRADKRALYAWYTEWADIARSLVSRRDHLIRLGLASRRKPAKKPTPA